MNLADHAVAYAAAGLEVFPCKPDKAPYTTHGMKQASADVALVRSWWENWPDAIIGCRAPRNAILLDSDPRHGGHTTLAALIAEHGPLPVTRSHYSGRGDGGHHLWFNRPDIAQLSTRLLDRWAQQHGTGEAVADGQRWTAGIDIIHHGLRYTILPPSPHPDTGRSYQWGPGGLDMPFVDMPDWLAELLTKPDDGQPVAVPALAVVGDDSIADWYSASHTWNELLAPAGWRLVSGDGDSDGSTWRHPTASAASSATIRHGCLFVYSTGTQFEPTGDGDPHGYTRFRAWAELNHGGNLTAAARIARELRDGPGASIINLRNIIAEPVEGHGDGVASWMPTPVDWRSFWDRDYLDEDWLLEPVLLRGRAHALYAPGKTGKSLLTLEGAVALATGTGFLRHPPRPPVHVVYLDYEMTDADLHQRLEAMGLDRDTDLSHLHYFLIPMLAPLDSVEGGQQVMALATHYQAELVVVDTTARAVAGEENDADTFRALNRHTGMALKNAGITYIRVDHAGKDAAKGQRGSSAKNDDVDVVFRLTATDPGRFTLECTHQRVGYVPQVTELARSDDPLHHEMVDPMMWPAETGGIAAHLDKIGVPLDASRRKAREAITAWNAEHPDDVLACRDKALGTALKWRRQNGMKVTDLLGHQAGHQELSTGGHGAGHQPAPKTKVLVTGRHQAGHQPAPTNGVTGHHGAPLKGAPGADRFPPAPVENLKKKVEPDPDDPLGLFADPDDPLGLFADPDPEERR